MMLNTALAINGSSEVPNAIDSDPAFLGWMVGSPPPDDRILRFDDGRYFH
jgi:hypothetical protein